MSSSVHVRAPCRLHFGMFGFGHADRPQFGGVGVMIDPPSVEVSCEPAAVFSATGDLADRTQRFAELAATAWGLRGLPSCRLCVRAPRDHVGLGVGTQLGLAVASALGSFLDLPPRPAAALAADIGRGRRSAVGTHGFEQGGLIVDGGHTSKCHIGALTQRADLPECWRFVLTCGKDQRGYAGQVESDMFSQLPPVPEEVTIELWRLVECEMLSALARRDCTAFGEAVYLFGLRAGECFAAAQGGPFASCEIAELVTAIRQLGVRGAGQSSWGPTVFAICESDVQARAVVDAIQARLGGATCDIQIARPNNRGATIR